MKSQQRREVKQVEIMRLDICTNSVFFEPECLILTLAEAKPNMY